MKACPFCAEDIKDAAIVCKYCGRDVPSWDSGDQSREVKQEPGFWLVEELKQIPRWRRLIYGVFFGVSLLVFLLVPSPDERDERPRQELVAAEVANEAKERLEAVHEATPPIPEPTALAPKRRTRTAT